MRKGELGERIRSKKKPTPKKLDFVPIALIVALAVLCIVLLTSPRSDTALVYVGGELVKEIELNADGEYTVGSEYGFNVIKVEKGYLWIEDSDCKAHTCQRLGKISRKGERLLCAPHKLIVLIPLDDGVEAVI